MHPLGDPSPHRISWVGGHSFGDTKRRWASSSCGMDGNLLLSSPGCLLLSHASLAPAQSEDVGVQTPKLGWEEGRVLPLLSPLYSILFCRDLPSISSGLERAIAAVGLDPHPLLLEPCWAKGMNQRALPGIFRVFPPKASSRRAKPKFSLLCTAANSRRVARRSDKGELGGGFCKLSTPAQPWGGFSLG